MPVVDGDFTQGQVSIRGELSGAAGAALYTAVQTALEARPPAVDIELSAVERMDSLGGAWLSRATAALRQADMPYRLHGAQGQVHEFLQLIGQALNTPAPPVPRQPGGLERLGGAVFSAWEEARVLWDLSLETIYWACLAPLTGKGLRWHTLLEELANMGVRAVFIVALMNVLLGLVIALMSAAQLRQFGAEIYVADLVVIAFARELAPMMTAIIVTARSGAAMTAELATMVVQEEIDALNSMGLHPTPFLIVPKFWGMLLAMPALSVLALFAGTLGGLAMGVFYLGFDVQTWVRETLTWVQVGDVLQGLIKSLVFGAIIVLNGCHNGLQVRGGAQGVGLATTRAVVIDVVLIVIWDMLFALFFEFVLPL